MTNKTFNERVRHLSKRAEDYIDDDDYQDIVSAINCMLSHKWDDDESMTMNERFEHVRESLKIDSNRKRGIVNFDKSVTKQMIDEATWGMLCMDVKGSSIII